MGNGEKSAGSDRLWIFDQAALCDGDVVLELGYGFTSWAISKIDRSPFSHALIWAGNADFVESVGTGVRNLSFQRVVIADRNRWKLRRHPDYEIGKRAALAARRMVAKHYNLSGALASVGPLRGLTSQTQAFCSELVAQAYHEAGCEVVPGCPSHKVTPRMLLESTILETTELPIIECAGASLERAQALLDRDEAYSTSSMAVEVQAARVAFAVVEPLLGSLPSLNLPGLVVPPGNLHELIDVLANVSSEQGRVVSDRLVAALRAEGYFHLIDAPVKLVRESWIAAGVCFRYDNMPPEELDGLRKDILERCREYEQTAKRYLDNALICDELSKRTGHPLWNELASMHWRNHQQVLMLRIMGTDL